MIAPRSPESPGPGSESEPCRPAGGPRPRESDTSYESQLSNLRHNLRTPLNQIIGYSEMLQEEAGDQGLDGYLPDLQKIRSAGGQLLALINENLATARVTAGKLDLDMLQRDCRTVLNLIIGYSELCQEEASESAQSRFAQDLGKIRLAAGNLMGLLNDTEVLKPLRCVPTSTPDPIALRPVTVDRAGPNVNGRPGTDVVAGAGPALRGRIMVVDDNEMNRDMLARRLIRQGHMLVMAEGGGQAIELLRQHQVDLILLDLVMPGMDGVQTLSLLKADATLRHTPVILLSALDELDRVVECIEMGADDYLQKPFNPVLLNARINACLEKKRLRDQERAFLAQLQSEREKSERLLLNVLPESIAERLKRGETRIADAFPEATVLFADLVNFTQLASRVSAGALVQLLNEVFSQFDWLVELHHLEKIKTIGDAYMVVGGLPEPRPGHTQAVAEMALDMQKVVGRFNLSSPTQVQLRIGIGSGPVVAGIIGNKKFIYDLWGDTVNIASRMESHGQVGCIQVCAETYRRLEPTHVLEHRGSVSIKGKGDMTTYFLRGRR